MIEFQFLSPHPTSFSEVRLLEDCVWTFTKRSGPGGQHRNKTQSAAILTHRPSGISAEANERRDQHQNRRVAVARLRMVLAWQVRDPERVELSTLWKDRTSGGKINVSAKHWDYPQLVAEAFDFLNAVDFSVAEAAVLLKVSTGQLTKFFRADPPTLTWLNRVRSERGLGTIK